jgi:drug/metabolite transporter (DMT)-like permease
MTLVDLLGFTGVSMILFAYFLNLTHRIEPDDLRYILLNLIGAILACAASILMKYMPFVLLEGVWTLVSLQALFQYFKNKKQER